jgi:hypothetical protein
VGYIPLRRTQGGPRLTTWDLFEVHPSSCRRSPRESKYTTHPGTTPATARCQKTVGMTTTAPGPTKTLKRTWHRKHPIHRGTGGKIGELTNAPDMDLVLVFADIGDVVRGISPDHLWPAARKWLPSSDEVWVACRAPGGGADKGITGCRG